METRGFIRKQFSQSRERWEGRKQGSGGEEGIASVKCLGLDLTGLGEGSGEERRGRVQGSHSHTQELYKINSLEEGHESHCRHTAFQKDSQRCPVST